MAERFYNSVNVQDVATSTEMAAAARGEREKVTSALAIRLFTFFIVEINLIRHLYVLHGTCSFLTFIARLTDWFGRVWS